MNPQCRECRTKILDLLSGSLTAERPEVDSHLDACSDCRAYWESLRQDDELLAGYAATARPAIEAVENSAIQALADLPGESASFSSRRVFRFRWLKTAIAAVVVLALWAGSGRLPGPLAVSTPTLARTLQTMRALPWVHSVSERLLPDGTQVEERWESGAAHIEAYKSPEGHVRYTDYPRKVTYQYNPNSNTITVAFTTDNYMLPRSKPAFEMLAEIVESAQQKRAAIPRRPAPEYGGHIELIRLDFADNPYIESSVLIRDTGQDLLLRMEQVLLKPQKHKVTTTFDYPDPGPADIYALGVPTDATVYDIRPEGPAMVLVDEVQRRFERGFGDHTAVVLESRVGSDGSQEPSTISVLRQQGDLKRCDHYYASSFPRIADAWPSLTIPQVLAMENTEALVWRMLFDGRRTIRLRRDRGELVRSEHATDQFKLSNATPFPDLLTRLVWPNLHGEILVGSSQFKREIRLLPDDPTRPGLVGLRFARFAETEDYWFDPAKDYMMTERILRREATGNVVSDIVVESAEASAGRWYPKIMRMERTVDAADGTQTTSHQQRRVLLDADPVFDPNLFTASDVERTETPATEPNVSVPGLPSQRGRR